MNDGELALHRADAGILNRSLRGGCECALRAVVVAALLVRIVSIRTLIAGINTGVVTNETILAEYRLLSVRAEWYLGSLVALAAGRLEGLRMATEAASEGLSRSVTSSEAWAAEIASACPALLVVLLEIVHV